MLTGIRIAHTAFWLLWCVTLLNISGLLTEASDESGNALNVYLFALAVFFGLPFLGRFPLTGYVKMSVLFMVVYTAGGFLGLVNRPSRVSDLSTYGYAQEIIKPVISVVGIPVLAFALKMHLQLVQLIRVAVLIAVIGAIIGTLQIIAPDTLPDIGTSEYRGSGFWVNPNLAGLILSLSFLLTFIVPLGASVLTNSARMILLIGVFATLSRGSILAFMIGISVFVMVQKRFDRTLAVTAGLVFFGFISLQIADVFIAERSYQRSRIEGIMDVFSGDIETLHTMSRDRTYIFRQAFETIMESGPVLGLGHGSMGNIVRINGRSIGPHNLYLFIWGTSGVAALIGFIAILHYFWRNSRMVPNRTIRAALMGMVCVIAFCSCFGHRLLSNQLLGPFLTMIGMVLASSSPRRSNVRSTTNIRNGEYVGSEMAEHSI